MLHALRQRFACSGLGILSPFATAKQAPAVLPGPSATYKTKLKLDKEVGGGVLSEIDPTSLV